MVFHGPHRNLYCCGDGALSLSAREMFWAFALPIQTRLGEGEQAATFPGTGLPGAFALHLYRFFRTFGAASKPLCSVNRLSMRE
jgi:hypothetical protein